MRAVESTVQQLTHLQQGPIEPEQVPAAEHGDRQDCGLWVHGGGRVSQSGSGASPNVLWGGHRLLRGGRALGLP